MTTKPSNGVITWGRLKSMILLVIKVISILIIIVGVGYKGYSQLDGRVDTLEIEQAVEAERDKSVCSRLDSIEVKVGKMYSVDSSFNIQLIEISRNISLILRKLEDTGG